METVWIIGNTHLNVSILRYNHFLVSTNFSIKQIAVIGIHLKQNSEQLEHQWVSVVFNIALIWINEIFRVIVLKIVSTGMRYQLIIIYLIMLRKDEQQYASFKLTLRNGVGLQGYIWIVVSGDSNCYYLHYNSAYNRRLNR